MLFQSDFNVIFMIKESNIRAPAFTTLYISLRKSDSILLDFSLTVKAAPHECVIRTSQP